MKSNYLKELEVTVILFRKKKLFRRWRRMYLNVTVVRKKNDTLCKKNDPCAKK